jgi:hypothetical protein
MGRLTNGPFDDLAEAAGLKGTDLCITPASTIYALVGPHAISPDGIARPEYGDIDDLRLLLRRCREQDVAEALVGVTGDIESTAMILRGVEDLYRRCAQLVGYRSDIHDREDPARDRRPFAERMANPDDIPF